MAAVTSGSWLTASAYALAAAPPRFVASPETCASAARAPRIARGSADVVRRASVIAVSARPAASPDTNASTAHERHP